MKKYLLILAITMLASCGVKPSDFSVDKVTNLELGRTSLSGAEAKITVSASNASKKDLNLSELRLDISTQEQSGVIKIILDGDVTVPARYSGEVVVPVKISYSLLQIPFLLNIVRDTPDEVSVKGYAVVKIGKFKKKITVDESLPKVMKRFGVSTETLKDAIKIPSGVDVLKNFLN